MPPEFSGEDQTALTPNADTPDATPAASSSGPDDTSPASSSGTDNSTPTEPKTMADAIAAAFDQATAPTKPEDDPDDTGADADADGTETAGATPADGKAKDGDKSTPNGEEAGTKTGEEELPDPSKEELAAMQPRVRRRVQQLLDQRRAAQQELTAIKPDAQSYRTIRTFMERNRLEDAEVAELFQIGADLKSGDPKRLQAFVDRVMPRVQAALEATGQRLPADLQGRVDTGEMTEDAAREFARTRYQAQLAQTQAQQAQQQVQTAQTVQVQQSILTTVNAWTDATRKADPDFDLKTEAMTLAAKAIVAERGHPRTPAQALEYAKAAYAQANAIMRRAKPQPTATRPTPDGNASTNRSGVRPAPASLADAIGQAFDQAVRG